MNLQKRIPYRNKAILKSAEGEDCTMESPWCNHNSETVCARHLNGTMGSIAGKVIGVKADDFAIFFGCQPCEDWYTTGYVGKETEAHRQISAAYAVLRTWRRLLDKGVLK